MSIHKYPTFVWSQSVFFDCAMCMLRLTLKASHLYVIPECLFSLCSFKHCIVPIFAFFFYKIRRYVCYNSNFLFWQIKRSILHLFHHVHISPGCLQGIKPMGWFLIELEQKGSSDLLRWCWRLTEQHICRNKFLNLWPYVSMKSLFSAWENECHPHL